MAEQNGIVAEVESFIEQWFSVCFYGDMITDPEERGEVIPGGLAGSDGYCFDIYEADDASVSYLKARLEEAWSRAASC